MFKVLLPIGLIIVVALALVLVNPTGSEYTTDWGGNDGNDLADSTGSIAGSWKEEVIVKYKDGTTDSLMVLGQGPLAVNYGDKEIESVTYTLSAKATGQGYEECEIDMTNVMVDESIYYNGPNGGRADLQYQKAHGFSETVSVPVNGEKKDLFSVETVVDDPQLSSTYIGASDEGKYQVIYTLDSLTATAHVPYRGVTDSSNSAWNNVGLPDGITVSIEVSSDATEKWIHLDLDSSWQAN